MREKKAKATLEIVFVNYVNGYVKKDVTLPSVYTSSLASSLKQIIYSSSSREWLSGVSYLEFHVCELSRHFSPAAAHSEQIRISVHNSHLKYSTLGWILRVQISHQEASGSKTYLFDGVEVSVWLLNPSFFLVAVSSTSSIIPLFLLLYAHEKTIRPKQL